MNEARKTAKAKLFIGIIFANKAPYNEAVSELVKKLGAIEAESEKYKFSAFTRHYEKEMGKNLWKKFIIFKTPIDRGALAETKLWTNALEKRFSKNGKRKINLDPGYITVHSLVLASTKDRAARIYLGKGIYADLTLLFSKKGCEQFSHTFADFKSETARGFFWNEREKLRHGQKKKQLPEL